MSTQPDSTEETPSKPTAADEALAESILTVRVHPDMAIPLAADWIAKHVSKAVFAATKDLREACDIVGTQVAAGADDCIREHERANKAEEAAFALAAENDSLRKALEDCQQTIEKNRLAIEHAGLGSISHELFFVAEAAKQLLTPNPQ